MRRRSKTIPSPPVVADDDRWRARDDLNTLKRAAEIQGDRNRYAAARAEGKREIKAVEKVVSKSRGRKA